MEPAGASPIEDLALAVRTALPPLTNGISTNTGPGTGTHTPQTPKLNTLSLTEYTAYPTPPSELNRARARSLVPEAFILPNGTPDVCLQTIL